MHVGKIDLRNGRSRDLLCFMGVLCVLLDRDPLDKNLIGPALALFFPLNEPNSLYRVQLRQQPHGLVTATANVLAHIVHGVVDVDPSGVVMPAVLSGQAHTVQQQAIQQFSGNRKLLEFRVIYQLMWNFEKRNLADCVAINMI